MVIAVNLKKYATLVLETGDEIKYLNAKSTNGVGNFVSAFDTTNTQYAVPAGKTLTLTSMTIIVQDVNRASPFEYKFTHGPTVNSNVGGTEWIDDSIQFADFNGTTISFPIFVVIPAGDYITVEFTGGDGQVQFIGVLS
jgi:hypothetical protein